MREHHTIINRQGCKVDALNTLRLIAKTSDVWEWWGHNAGRFDGLFLVEAALESNGAWEVSATVAGGGAVITFVFRHKEDKRAIKLHDSLRVVPSKLKDACESFECASTKLLGADDYSIDASKWSDERLTEGSQADCECGLELIERVESIVEDWGGQLKPTFSSTALSIVKANIDCKLPSHVGNEDLNALCRKGYYGGRVEVFEHAPLGLCLDFDINSSYPAAMTRVLPWELVGTNFTAKELERMLDDDCPYEGIAFAGVSVPEMQLPPLPYRSAGNRGIYFPVGRWQGWFSLAELRYARTHNVSVDVAECVAYSQATPFAEFIKKVYALKSTSTGAKRNFAKLVLNGCYGKFAQKPEVQTLKLFSDADEATYFRASTPQGTTGLIGNDERFVYITKNRWPKHTHYALASYITAYARIAWHRFASGFEGLCYGDSDSFHCSDSAHNRSVWKDRTSKQLGDLSIKHEGFEGKYYAPKIYQLVGGKEPVFACKGFPVNAESFARIVEGETVEREGITPLKSVLRNGGRVARYGKQEDAETSLAPIAKRWIGHSTKRKPYPDGSTRAWTVKEIEKGEHLNAVSPLFKKGSQFP